MHAFRSLAWIISLLTQTVIGSTLFLTFTVIHLKKYVDIFWPVYLIIIVIIGLAIPILLFFITNKWYFGIKSSIIIGFFILITSIIITYFLIRKPDERGAIFLPLITGFIELIYIISNSVGAVVAYILSQKNHNS